MMSKEAAHFVFMTCRAGAEAALKQEVARTQPAWRPSFSRPGFLTFKCGGETPLDDRELGERHWTFAHAHGISLGKVSGLQLADLVQQVWQHAGVAALVESKTPLDIHVWQREPAIDDDDGETFVTPLCQEIEVALRAAAPERSGIERTVAKSRRATPRNSRVLDVVVVAPDEWWIGYHRAIRRTERWPGGVIPVRQPAHAVSRAYAKLEEAIQWSDLPLAKEDECVEIGCAPGGASQALLDRGMFVTGIDPAEVDPAVVGHPRFRHLKKRGSDVRRQEFLGVRWLAADMNIAPDDTLSEVEAIVTSPQASIRGLVLTLKLSDWSIASRLPEFVERVRGWGYRDVRTRQLLTGGQEVCLVALRRKALRRLSGKHNRKRKPRVSGETRVDQPHTTPSEPHF
jgi:23S rRNA (cytidine2498-2'-O)-methyltransferase